MECLSDTSHVAMPENSKHTFYKLMLDSITLCVLVVYVANQRLCHG